MVQIPNLPGHSPHIENLLAIANIARWLEKVHDCEDLLYKIPTVGFSSS